MFIPSLSSSSLPQNPLIVNQKKFLTKETANESLAQALGQCKDAPLPNEAFAALHGGVEFEGITSPGKTFHFTETVAWWKNKLSSLSRSEEGDLSFWVQDLEQMEEGLELLNKGASAAPALKQYIKEQLDETNRCVLPLPFKHTNTGLIHVLVCVFEKDNKGIARVRLLDKGVCAENQVPALILEGGKVKRSYTDLPVRLRDNFFSEERGYADHLFECLSDFARGAVSPSTSTSTPSIIYGLFHEIIGEVHAEDVTQPVENQSGRPKLWFSPEMAVTVGQSERSIHQLAPLMLRDQIVQGMTPHSMDEYKRAILLIKIQSWMDMAAELQSNPDKQIAIEFLSQCLKNFNASIEKGYQKKHISEDELLICQALNEELQSLFLRRTAKTPVVVPSVPLEKIDDKATHLKAVLPPLSKPPAPIETTLKTLIPFKDPSNKSEKITEELKELCETANKSDPEFRFQIVNSFVLKLSLEKEFWDQVPDDKLLDTLKFLKEAIQLTADSFGSVERQQQLHPELSLLAASGYIIADHLVHRLTGENGLPNLHLDKRAFLFPEPPDSFYFHNKESDTHWKAICNRLREVQLSDRLSYFFRCKGADADNICYEPLTVNDKHTEEKRLTQYLQKLRGGKQPSNLEDLGDIYIEKEVDDNNKTKGIPKVKKRDEGPYPASFYDYYYFHILTSRLFERSPNLSPQVLKELIGCNKTLRVTLQTHKPKNSHSTNRSYIVDYQNIDGYAGNGEGTTRLHTQRLSDLGRLKGAISTGEKENELAVRKEEELYTNSNIFLKDFKKIERDPQLQLSMLMQWCRRHTEILEQTEVQSFVEYILLRKDSPVETAAPLVKKELFGFIQEQINHSSTHLSTLNTRLFWIRIYLHLKEREKNSKDEIDSWLDEQLPQLEEAFYQLQDAHEDKDIDIFKLAADKLATHLTYFSTRYSDFNPKRAEQFLGWHLLRFILKSDSSDAPYWMSVDIDQFFVDRGHCLFPHMKNIKALPKQLGCFKYSPFAGISDVEVKQPQLGLYKLEGNGHHIDFDVFNKTVSLDGQKISFGDAILTPSERRFINQWDLTKKWIPCAERLIKEGVRKSVTVTGVEITKSGANICTLDETYRLIGNSLYRDFPRELLRTLNLSKEEKEIWNVQERISSNKTPPLIKVSPTTFQCADGSARFTQSKEKVFELQERITIEGHSGWYKKMNKPPKLPAGLCLGTIWERSFDSPSALPQYLIRVSGKPVAEIESIDKDNIRIHKLDEKGVRTGECLADLQNLPQISFLKQMGQERLLLWAKEGQVVRAENIEHKDLTFLYDGTTWTCSKFPGYQVDENGPFDVGRFNHGVMLIKGNQKQLLLPCKQVVPLNGHYQLKSKPIDGIEKESLLIYKQDPISHEWVGTTDTARLYLAYLYIEAGNEENARKAIGSMELNSLLTPQQWEIFALIASSSNLSPEASALKMRLATLVRENSKKPRFNSRPVANGEVQSSFWKSIAKEMSRFLNLQGAEFSRVPSRFYITEKQIGNILSDIVSYKRQDGTTDLETPARILQESTHYFFYPEKAPKPTADAWKWSEHWLNPHHFWNTMYEFLRNKDVNYANEKRGTVPTNLWIPVQKHLRDDFPSYCDVSKIPTNSDKVPGHSYEALKGNFWILMNRMHELSIQGKLNQDVVNDIDVDLYLYYSKLYEEAIKNPNTNDSRSDWAQGTTLISMLWLVRVSGPQFFDFLSAKNITPEKWNLSIFSAYFDYAKCQLKLFEGRENPFVLNKNAPPPRLIPTQITSWKDLIEPHKQTQLVSEEIDKFKPVRLLKKLLKEFFQKDTLPIYSEDKQEFVIDPNQAERLFGQNAKKGAEEIKKSFEEKESDEILPVCKQTFESYRLKEAQNETKLEQELKNQIKTLDLPSLEEEIVRAANYPSIAEQKELKREDQLQAALRDQQIASKKMLPLTFLDILLKFDPQDPKAIKKENFCLTDEKVQELHNLCLQYFVMQNNKTILEDALACLDKSEEGLERCAEILAKKQTFDLEKNWILSLYQGMTKQILRSDPAQAKLIQDIAKEIFNEKDAKRSQEKLKQFFFECQAGGGKTKVIAILLAILAKRYGKTPVFISLSQLFDITKQDLTDSADLLARKLFLPINMKLNQNPTLKELYDLLEALEKMPDSEKYLGIVTTAETFQAITLEYELALIYGEAERVQVLDKILCFFEDNAIDLVDEGHRNANPLFEWKMAFGKGEPIPEYVSDLYIEFFQFLIEDPYWEKIVGLKEGKQTRLSSEQVNELKQALATHFANKIVNSKDPQLLHYLTDLNEKPSAELLGLNGSNKEEDVLKAKQLAVLRGFINKILPHTLGLVEDIDHGPSVDPSNEVEAPRSRKEKTLAKFENPELSVALTIKGFLQRGFTNPGQMQRLVKFLREDMEREKLKVPSGELTPTEEKFLLWQKGQNIKVGLTDLPETASKTTWNSLLEKLKNNPDSIFEYLKAKPLMEIILYPLKITSTASRFAYGFFGNIFFSATLGPLEKYPFFGDPKFYRRDLSFLAKVMQVGSYTPNDKFVWYDSDEPDSFFKNLPQDLLQEKRLEGIINFGGAAPGKSNRDWAVHACSYFETHKIPFDGVVYVHQEVVNGREGEKILYLLERNSSTPIALTGSRLKEELKNIGKENLKFFKVYGPEDTTGLDLALEPNALMAVTLGENPSTDEVAQALLRMRQFIKPRKNQKDGQGAIWCLPKELKEKTLRTVGKGNDQEIDAKDCFLWALDNYCKRLEAEIVAAAFQELEGLCIEIARMDMRKKSGAAQIKLFKDKYRSGFVKKGSYDPFENHGHSSELRPTKEVLQQFMDNCSKSYNVDLKDPAHAWASARKEQIITRTSDAVPNLQEKRQSALGGQTFERQRTHEQQQQRTKHHQQEQNHAQLKVQNIYSNVPSRPEKRYATTELALMQNDLLTKTDFVRPARGHFGIEEIPASLYLTVDALQATNVEDVWSIQGLKEADHLLIVQEGSEAPVYIALSQDNAKDYLEQIENRSIKNGRKCALIGKDGTLVVNGTGLLQGFDEEWLLGLKQNPQFKEVSAWLGLMCGQVTQRSLLKNLLIQDKIEEAIVKLFKLAYEQQLNPSSRELKSFNDLLFEKHGKAPPKQLILSEQSLDQYLKGETRDKSLKEIINKELVVNLPKDTQKSQPERPVHLNKPPSAPKIRTPKIKETIREIAAEPKPEENAVQVVAEPKTEEINTASQPAIPVVEEQTIGDSKNSAVTSTSNTHSSTVIIQPQLVSQMVDINTTAQPMTPVDELKQVVTGQIQLTTYTINLETPGAGVGLNDNEDQNIEGLSSNDIPVDQKNEVELDEEHKEVKEQDGDSNNSIPPAGGKSSFTAKLWTGFTASTAAACVVLEGLAYFGVFNSSLLLVPGLGFAAAGFFGFLSLLGIYFLAKKQK